MSPSGHTPLAQFRFNYWNRDFFDELENRSPDHLRTQALLVIPLCSASVARAVASVWGGGA